METISGSSFYAAVLSWAFLATNSLRVFAYLPTIKKTAACRGDSRLPKPTHMAALVGIQSDASAAFV